METQAKLNASFRDPSGFLFRREGVLYRQVNQKYRAEYEQLMQSGLYAKLVKAGQLIPHKEVEIGAEQPEIAYRILQPELVSFISYPYEWSFGQLKDAALTTLAITRQALELGMLLKDASAYNIQFQHGKPVLIDTLSFEIYQEGRPWVAYRQFCQHFLAPLALMAFSDVRLNQLLRVYIDGIPLDLASKLLPGKTRWNFGLASHIHLHASAQKRYADQAVEKAAVEKRMSKLSLLGLLDNLEGTVRGLKWAPAGTEWGDYYDSTNYTREAFELKKSLVSTCVGRVKPAQVWDLGANNGEFSRLASAQGIDTIAFDIDPDAVEKNYQAVKTNGEKKMLPLLLDLTNPSPAIGWENRERESLAERGPADLVLALAVIHHLSPIDILETTRLKWISDVAFSVNNNNVKLG
ncbi:class I SAM-dependent methyltransferase [bacterium]|nr:MAG: class I SAM-dependent methyltransferase [bacterium]